MFNGDSVVSGTGTIGGSGNLTVNSGTVVFDGVSRPGSNGNITIAAGATLEIKSGCKLLTDNYNTATVVNVSGTLKLASLAYGGNFGSLRDNTGSLVLNNGARIEITETGNATIGALLNGWGSTYTIAVLDGKKFTWSESGTGNVKVQNGSGAGCAFSFEVGENAVFTMQKDICVKNGENSLGPVGLAISKNGTGEMILDSTVILNAGRAIWVNNGTLKLGANADIRSAGDGVSVGADGTFDLNGADFEHDIYMTIGGQLKNGQKHRGDVIFSAAVGGDDVDNSIAYDEYANVGRTLFFADVKNDEGETIVNEYIINLNQDADIRALGGLKPEYGRISSESCTICINGAEEEVALSVSDCDSVLGAINTEGDVYISNVTDVTLSGNHAVEWSEDEFQRAGAINAFGFVSVEASGDINITGNSAAVNSDVAGAIYGCGISLSGASVTIDGNESGAGNAENPLNSAGALMSMDTITISATDGDIVVSGNSTEVSGGALYAWGALEISATGDIDISNNIALTGEGGAIYSEEAVTFMPVEGGNVSISGNEAGTNGGAIYAYTVVMNGGSYSVSDNTAGSEGGAIYAEELLELTADAGNISFSGNTDAEGANDIAMGGSDSEAYLSAYNGNTLTLNGGLRNAGALSIETDADSAIVLGGVNSSEYLTIADDSNVRGVFTEDETPVITFSETAEVGSAYLQDVRLNGGLTSIPDATVGEDAVSGTLLLGGTVFSLNNSEPLTESVLFNSEGTITLTYDLPLIDDAMVEGSMTLNITERFLDGAIAMAGENVVDIIIRLTGDNVYTNGEFALTLSDELIVILDSASATYGIYDVDGVQIGITEADLSTAPYGATVVIKGLNQSVPEPGTATLSLLALAALASRRRRK